MIIQRNRLICALIMTAFQRLYMQITELSFHYVPLHSAPAGIQYGRFAGVDEYTTKESNRLTRLPLYYGLTEADRAAVVQVVKDFFAQK